MTIARRVADLFERSLQEPTSRDMVAVEREGL